jgi:TetR/AcrR family transcriptional regulator, regulator of biofilm formation and stress response
MEREHRRRSLERRAALVRATISVLADRGVAGVTHRAVTEAAGVPLATVSYFWSSIDELTNEALSTIVTEDATGLAEATAGLTGDLASAEELATVAARVSAPRRPETIAQFEAYLDAARSTRHRPAVADAIGAFRRVAEATLAGAGLADASAAAEALVALSDGFALLQLATAADLDAEAGTSTGTGTGTGGIGGTAALERAFRALIAGYLVEQGDVAAAATVVGTDTGTAAP